MTGGARASFAKLYNKELVTEVQYGTTFNTLQEALTLC